MFADNLHEASALIVSAGFLLALLGWCVYVYVSDMGVQECPTGALDVEAPRVPSLLLGIHAFLLWIICLVRRKAAPDGEEGPSASITLSEDAQVIRGGNPTRGHSFGIRPVRTPDPLFWRAVRR